MSMIDIVTIIVAVISALVGFIGGFGKGLKLFTKGVFGIIISVFVTATFAGLVLKIDRVSVWVADITALAAEKWAFFGTINIGLIAYYVVFFLFVQLLRILVVKVICGIFEADNKVMKAINRVLGLIFVPAVVLTLVLLVFAVFKIVDETQFVQDIAAKIDGTFLGILYENNPIRLYA
ncbi:MAG: hypothetical protein IJ735_02760 [Clostridia bacterium]|nr:hypothetical protein [Clostridia bacterium]